MAIQNRFRVHKADNTLHLQGVISDTTNFKVIDEMIDGTDEFDCSNLMSASWNGVIKFDKYLRELNSTVTLTNIPNHIFNYLRLMPEVNRTYKLDQVELNVVQVDCPSLETKNVFLSTQDLQLISNETSRAFLRVSSNEEIIGRDNFICPDKFGSSSNLPGSEGGKWYRENLEEFNFWFDYCNFANTTGFLALDLVESLSTTLANLLREIELGVKSCEKAVALVSGDENENTAAGIDSIIDDVTKSCHKLSESMKGATHNSQKTLLQMQLLADKEEFADRMPLYTLIKDFTDTTLSLRPILPNVEEIGANTGSKISHLAIVDTIKKKLQLVEDDSVTPELLEEVRDILEIMDPLSEDSWVDTKEEFLEQINSIDSAISDAVILLQGFDLLRQILEHRFTESETIQGYLDRPQSQNWSEIQGDVFKLVNKSLVTDQEKYSCEFFIPDAAESESEKHAPGDVLLF